VATEATILTGWIYDHLLPHAQQVKVAHPLMLRAPSLRPRRRTIGSMPADTTRPVETRLEQSLGSSE
jgi:hypothetical protein